MEYIPSRAFTKLYCKDKVGRRLWEFLNETENFIRMETATFLNRPAVEALAPSLLDRFGGKVREDQVKRMIGHMVRQIMDSSGYEVRSFGVKIRSGLFKQGTRYQAREYHGSSLLSEM